MTAFQMLDEVAAVTAERDRARDLAAKLEARLELAERVVEAGRQVARQPNIGWGLDAIGEHCGVCGDDFYGCPRLCIGRALRAALAAYDGASR